uniref:Uncharacterized protein n=1 Tax=Oncorhynchus mykiss TaxID=8022 RepID=A0A8C7QQZ5_ONCMY
MQVRPSQFFSQHHCINATDLHIFTLFLKIPWRCHPRHIGCFSATTSVGLFCLFSNPGPFFVCSYPHDKVNRLSCDKARNYYSGVVSLILLALELLQRMVSSYTYYVSFSLTGHATCAHNTKKTQAKRTGAWHAIKPAWRPPNGCHVAHLTQENV